MLSHFQLLHDCRNSENTDRSLRCTVQQDLSDSKFTFLLPKASSTSCTNNIAFIRLLFNMSPDNLTATRTRNFSFCFNKIPHPYVFYLIYFSPLTDTIFISMPLDWEDCCLGIVGPYLKNLTFWQIHFWLTSEYSSYAQAFAVLYGSKL